MRTFGQLRSKALDKTLMALGGKRGRNVKFEIKDLSKTERYTMVMRIDGPNVGPLNQSSESRTGRSRTN